MNYARMFHKIGSWSYVLLGIGHIATHLFLPKTPEQEQMILRMKDFAIDMPGPDSTLFLFHEGFSLMMGVLLISYGIANILFLSSDSLDSLTNKHIATLNIIVSLVAMILSAVYFFIVPIAFTTASVIAFGLAFGLTRRSTGRTKAAHQ